MFWYIRSPEKHRFAERVHGLNKYEIVKCIHDYGHQRPGRLLNTPIVTFPKKHVVWTYDSDCLISSEVLDALLKHHLTGFYTTPLKIYDKASKTIRNSNWFHLQVFGWGGVANKSTGIRVKTYCPYCEYLVFDEIKRPQALYNPDDWDGNDFFMIWPLPRFILVSDEAMDLMRSYFEGVAFTRIVDLKISGACPGKLSYYMPAERLRDLPNVEDPNFYK